MNKKMLKEIKKLDVCYIIWDGYYSNKDDGEALNNHTKTTLELYKKGLNLFDIHLENDDIFNGICIENEPLAEWTINNETKYFHI